MEKDSTSTAPSANVEDSNEVWWIDADPGTDDAVAMAIMLANKNVIGMTISLGNGTIKQCLINAAKVLGVLKKKVPLYKGSSKAITQAVFHGTDGFFGSDSMGDSKMFKDFEGYRDCWRDENGHVAMLKASKEAQKNGKKFKLLCLAPLTTVAVALSIDAKFVDRVDSIVVMGGAIEGQGFTKMSTEFNFDRDPEAAYKVLRDFKNVYVLPIETEKGGVMTIEELKSLRFQGTVFSDFFREIVRFIAINKDDEKALLGALFDAMAAAFCVNHEIASKIIRVNTTVDIDGNFTTGSMIVEYSEINSDHDVFYGQEKQNKNLTNVIVEFDHDKYMELIYRVFKYYDHKEL